MDSGAPKITSAVIGEYLMTALVWLVPGLLLLPLYLLLIGISVLGGEGALLEIALKAKGGVHSAIGLLLVLGALAMLVFVAMEATEFVDWVETFPWILVTGGLGVYFVRRELRKIAARQG